MPELLINSFINKEKNYILNDLNTYISNIQIFLTVNDSMYNALKNSIDSINYYRFKEALTEFVEEYRIYNYNTKKASYKLLEKFNIDELNIFLDILHINESNNSIIKILSGLKKILNEKLNKNLKIMHMRENYNIVICILLLLCMTFLTVMFPIFVQIVNNLNAIFS